MIASRVPHFNTTLERGKSTSKNPEPLSVHSEAAGCKLVVELRRKPARKRLMLGPEDVDGERLGLSEHWTASSSAV